MNNIIKTADKNSVCRFLVKYTVFISDYVQSLTVHYPTHTANIQKGRNCRRRHAARSELHIGATDGGTPQGRNCISVQPTAARRKVGTASELLGLISKLICDEDYLYSVLITLMCHNDIIVAYSVGRKTMTASACLCTRRISAEPYAV